MRLAPPSGLTTTKGVDAWGRKLIASIAAPWSQEHLVDGRHHFAWTDVPYSAGRYSGSGSMTWTVDSSDQLSLMYRYVGDDTIELQWTIVASAVGGTVDTELRIALPDRLRATHYMNSTHWYQDATTEGIGWCGVYPSDVFVRLYILGSGNWSLSGGGSVTASQGQMTLRVE